MPPQYFVETIKLKPKKSILILREDVGLSEIFVFYKTLCLCQKSQSLFYHERGINLQNLKDSINLYPSVKIGFYAVLSIIIALSYHFTAQSLAQLKRLFSPSDSPLQA